MRRITIARRVYYDDTDAAGVMYHTHYLRYMEHARSDLLQAHELAPPQLAERYGVVFVVARLEVEYRAPARLGDALEVDAVVVEVGRVGLDFEQAVRRSGSENPLCRARVQVACLDAARFRPVRIPDAVRECLHHAE
ncbi:MAG: hypothetical protein KatS3mg121_0351 [Gammaproteobacteria bacterium]|nr:MAG: hypothetical protein KatS3mg121_0351 [Gammaproteobacteria bacterium]